LNKLYMFVYTSHMNQLRAEAERLRDLGYSYNMITEVLGIARSTMSYWFKDRPFAPNYEALERIKYGPLKSGALKHNRKVEEIARMREVGISEVGDLTPRDIWMLGLGLYIGEGAKTVETVRVANSNPAVIRAMVRWLKETCGLEDNNIRLRIHLYPDCNEEEALQYWRTVTGLPSSNFKKTSIDTRQNKRRSMHGKLPYGTAHIYVAAWGDPNKGARLFRRVNGWMAGALEQL